MTEPARLVAEAFGLARPAEPLRQWSYSSSRTWRLSTGDGTVLVKQVECDGWRDSFVRAMAFEDRVRAAGISLPVPVAPVTPTLGHAVDVPGFGLLRAYEWLPGRALTPDDDVTDWLGATLARLHRIEPLAEADPEVYGLHDEIEWQGWLDEGRRQGRPWAPLLARRLSRILADSERIERTFRSAGDHVRTHRDVEPWNVLLVADGPVLLDWDTAGPDSAGLEAAHAGYNFAAFGRALPDPVIGRRVVDAYLRHGGRLPATDDPLARRAGMLLSRLVERIRISIGWQRSGALDVAELDRTSVARLERWPLFRAHLADWADQVTPPAARAR